MMATRKPCQNGKVSRADKPMDKVMSGRQDENIGFADLCHLLIKLGYSMRQKGSHHSFTRLGSNAFINIQPNGSKAKSYQVRQIRAILEAR
jgi:predicted RNA binding protein YcfA (HicA-like mRNA interferase family)